MLSAILSNSGTGCLSMSGQAPPPLPWPRPPLPYSRRGCSWAYGGDRQPPFKSRQNCYRLLFSPFVCVSETNSVLWKLSVPSRANIFICVYICSHVYIWSWCKGCIYGLTLLNMCHFTVPPCLLTLLSWEATEARSPLSVQEKHSPPCPVACKAITGYTFREW